MQATGEIDTAGRLAAGIKNICLNFPKRHCAPRLKILILSSSTGGGHDTRARSLAQWATSPECAQLRLQTVRRQALEETGGIYAFGANLYNWIQLYWPALHHIYFNVLEIVPFCGSSAGMPGKKDFQNFIRAEAPDIVISTHDHLNHAFLEAAREALPGRPPLVGTYCGELAGGYGFSKHWVNPHADFFVGAVEDCAAQARKLGMPAERTFAGGFMLNPDFWSPKISAEEREKIFRDELNLDPGRFTLLLATGENGANNHLATLDRFARAGVHPQVIALCGKNERAKIDIEAWARAHPQIPVCALAYQTRMKRVMECADAIFARPGTGTTSEAILAGLPIIFNGIGGVMPQEIITVRYAKKFFETNVVKRAGALPEIVSAWMRDTERLKKVKAGVIAARPAGHPSEILKKLATLVPARPETPVPAVYPG